MLASKRDVAGGDGRAPRWFWRGHLQGVKSSAWRMVLASGKNGDGCRRGLVVSLGLVVLQVGGGSSASPHAAVAAACAFRG